MANISRSDFLEGIRKSGIVAPERLADLLENVTEESPEAIAVLLVREALATKWQAKYLMSGRSRLDIGSYRLLDRINRDEFGDRFLAIHTSLARKVDIQVLPFTLTKDQASRDRFIQKASLAAQLDHPNLTHVYDIDQEGGRYYLVTEHVEGKSLEDIDVSTLSDTMIARIISQAVDGICYAHQHEVIHGCIGPADLMLDSHQQVKIQHLPLSPLRHQISGNKDQPRTEQDFSAIARIGSFLLKKANISNPERRNQLAIAFEKLSDATAESVAETTKTLEQFLAVGSKQTGFDPGGFEQPIETTSTPRKKKQRAPENMPLPPESINPGYLKRLWKDNPIAVIGTSLVIALMLVGGSVYGGIAWLGKLSPPVADPVEIEDSDSSTVQEPRIAITNPPSVEATLNPSPRPSRPNQISPAIPTDEEMSEFLAEMENGTGQRELDKSKNRRVKLDQATDREKPASPAMKNELDVPSSDDQFAGKNAAEPGSSGEPSAHPESLPKSTDSTAAIETKNEAEPDKSTQLSPTDNAAMADGEVTDMKPVHNDLTVIRGIAGKTQATLQNGEVTSLEQIAAMSPEEIQTALRKGGWGTANKIAEYKDWISQAKVMVGDESPMKTSPADNHTDAAVPDSNGVFANFPRVTDLPPLESTAEIKIADLIIKKQYLLGAELICEPGAVEGRTTFELERSMDDNQTWIVGVRKSPNQDATPIALFRKSETAFHFQWLPEAVSDKNASKLAPYLCNCFVKLILPEDESTVLTLRTPLKIADLRLTTEALWNEVEVLIPAMPEPENIVVEVLPLQIPNVDTRIPNSRVERGNPARIWLKRDDKTGFLWIQVSGELRSRLKLRSNLMLLVQGQAKPVPRMQTLQELALTLDAAAVRAQLTYEQFSKPVSMKKDDFDRQKSQFLRDAKTKQAMKDQLINYGEILPKIMNQPISVRVYSKLGNFQTVLAVTDPTLEQEPK